jgi:hypothetical protein
MDLHRGFGDAQVAGNLLVQTPLSDLSQDCALARRQDFESRPKRAQCFFILAACTVSGEPNIHSVQEILVPERLREELDGACLHRLHTHRDVAMSGHEDDRESDARRGEIALKIQSALTRQSHIEDETSSAIGRFATEKIGHGRK